MPITVTKTFLVDTDNVDEAYEMTKIQNEKVDTLAIGAITPYRVQPQPPLRAMVPAQPAPVKKTNQ